MTGHELKDRDYIVVKTEVLLGASEKLGRATAGWLCYVCPSVRVKQLGSHWTDFHEI